MTFCQREKYWCEILSQRKISVSSVREKDIGFKFCHRERNLCELFVTEINIGVSFCHRERYWCELLSQTKILVITFVQKKSISVIFCQRERYWCELLPQLVTFLQLPAAMTNRHCALLPLCKCNSDVPLPHNMNITVFLKSYTCKNWTQKLFMIFSVKG